MTVPDAFNGAHLLAIGTCFALWDAFGIGANDVANAFSTSVNSGVFTMTQAAIVAVVLEFLGAVTAGAGVAGTIQKGILDAGAFRGKEGLLQLCMVCALMASASWLQIANRYALPVSTTHSIVGGVIGVGVAALGPTAIEWGFCVGSNTGAATTVKCNTIGNGPSPILGDALSQIPGNGFGPIAVSWIMSPICAGIFAATMFSLTRYFVLEDNMVSKLIYGKSTPANNAFFRALIISPIIYGFIASILVVLLSVKGVAGSSSGSVAGQLGDINKDVSTLSQNAGITGIIIALLAAVYVSYYQYRVNWNGETFTALEYLYFFVLPKRPAREGFDVEHLKTEVKLKSVVSGAVSLENITAELKPNLDLDDLLAAKPAEEVPAEMAAALAVAAEKGWVVKPMTVHEKIMAGYWKSFSTGSLKDRVLSVLISPFKFIFCYGLMGADGAEREVRSHKAHENREMHQVAKQFDDRSELVFRQLQMMTSCIAAFAHGSNDVANAMGPLSTVLGVYRCTNVKNSKSPTGWECVSANNIAGVKPGTVFSAANGWEVPLWLLAVGGLMIGIGFCTYGFHLMRSLGNNLTYHSPSRGYCMEMGAAITVLMASRIGLPISTTQCITGATMAVGLLNGARGVNWKRFAGIFLAWIVTMPFVGIYAGLLLLFLASNPNYRAPGP